MQTVSTNLRNSAGNTTYLRQFKSYGRNRNEIQLMKRFTIHLILISIFLHSCSVNRKNIKHIKNNPIEISEFKLYLEENYQINLFDSSKVTDWIWGNTNQTDTIIKQYCTQNRISSITKIEKDENDFYYNKYGNIVLLYFQHIPIIGNNKRIVFDYSEKGLESYDERYTKSKIADRIYIFD